jgi:GNAT superfamily N-acetyltransferase
MKDFRWNPQMKRVSDDSTVGTLKTHLMNSEITTVKNDFVTRLAQRDDIDALILMCREHALYEKATFDSTDMSARLEAALFGSRRLHAWVVEAQDGLIAYATATVDFATWGAREYLHMDCLFVRESWRGRGVGASLLNQVLKIARRCGCREVQWQTPAWNMDAVQFYRRKGALGAEKLRFTIATNPTES